MAGSFLLTAYEADDAVAYPIRVQPETAFVGNALSAETITGKGTVRVSGSRRAYGRKARSVSLSKTVGDDTDYNGAKVYARLPVFTEEAYDALVIGAEVEYQSETWTIAGKNPESFR